MFPILASGLGLVLLLIVGYGVLRASPLDPGTALLVATVPGLWLLAVHAIAQRTWPRAAGAVRRARLEARHAAGLLPPVLTRVVAGIGVATLAALALAWTTPRVAPVHLSYAMAAAFAEGVTLDGAGGAHLEFTGPPPAGLPAAFDYVRHGTPVAALLGLVVLLLWRPSTVKEQGRA